MKKPMFHFNFKVFAIAVTCCAVFAALVTSITGLKFWVLLLIFIGALVVNGLIAGVDDREDG